MVFVTAGNCRVQLENLSQLLVSAFPGSTIYRHTDYFRGLHDILHNRVDAIFLLEEADKTKDLKFMQMLRREKPDVPVFVISDSDDPGEERSGEETENHVLCHVDQQRLRDAMQAVKRKEH